MRGHGADGLANSVIVWRRTWDDDLTVEDYTAMVGDRQIGRVYDRPGQPKRAAWFWCIWFNRNETGTTPSRLEAMQAVEDRWNASKSVES